MKNETFCLTGIAHGRRARHEHPACCRTGRDGSPKLRDGSDPLQGCVIATTTSGTVSAMMPVTVG